MELRGWELVKRNALDSRLMEVWWLEEAYFLFLRSSELIRPRRGWSRRKCCGPSRGVWRPWNGNLGSIKKLCTHRLRSLFANWSGRSTVSRTSWSTTTNSVGWVSFTLPLYILCSTILNCLLKILIFRNSTTKIRKTRIFQKKRRKSGKKEQSSWSIFKKKKLLCYFLYYLPLFLSFFSIDPRSKLDDTKLTDRLKNGNWISGNKGESFLLPCII